MKSLPPTLKTVAETALGFAVAWASWAAIGGVWAYGPPIAYALARGFLPFGAPSLRAVYRESLEVDETCVRRLARSTILIQLVFFALLLALPVWSFGQHGHSVLTVWSTQVAFVVLGAAFRTMAELRVGPFRTAV